MIHEGYHCDNLGWLLLPFGQSPVGDYFVPLPKIACYSPHKPIDSQRGQFWGRAALAPVVLMGYGRFYLFQTISAPTLLRLSSLPFRERLATFLNNKASYLCMVPVTLDVSGGNREEDHGRIGSFRSQRRDI